MRPNAVVFDWRALHVWQIQPVRDVLLIAAVIGLLYLGYRLSLVTVPILLALLLAYLFEPLVKRLTRVKWMSRQGAAVLIIAVSGVAIVVPATLGISFAAAQGIALVQGVAVKIDALQHSIAHPDDAAARARVPRGLWSTVRDKVIELRAAEKRRAEAEAARLSDEAGEPPRSTGGAPHAVAEPAETAPPPEESTEPVVRMVDWALAWTDRNAEAVLKSVGRQAIGTGSEAVGALVRTLRSAGILVFTLFLTAFFFYFFCTGWGRVLEFTRKFIPREKLGRTHELVAQMDRVIAGFVRGRLIICAIQCVLYSLGFAVVGVPAPFIVGVIVGILAIAPYGGLLGVPLALILIWLDPPGGFRAAWWWITFGPIVVYQLGQMLDDYVLTPRIQGQATNLDTPSILFASLTGGILAGFYGLLLAIPVAACLKILGREMLMPKIKAWAEGRAKDPLPLGGGGERE